MWTLVDSNSKQVMIRHFEPQLRDFSHMLRGHFTYLVP